MVSSKEQLMFYPYQVIEFLGVIVDSKNIEPSVLQEKIGKNDFSSCPSKTKTSFSLGTYNDHRQTVIYSSSCTRSKIKQQISAGSAYLCSERRSILSPRVISLNRESLAEMLEEQFKDKQWPSTNVFSTATMQL